MTTTSTTTTAPDPLREHPPEPPHRGRRRRERVNVPGALGAGVWFVIVAVPLYFLFVTSFRASSDYLADGPLAVPSGLTLDNYADVLTSNFPRYFANNVIVAAACVAIVLVLALPAAYAIVRSRSRWVARSFTLLLLGLAVPAQAVIVPLYLMVTQLRLYDTLLAIILPTAAFALPLAVVVLTSSLRDVPNELFEAAVLDGAGPGRVLWSLVLPLARPGLATIGIFTALQAWNGFLFPLVLTQNAAVRVLTLGLWDFQGQYGTNVPLVTAAVLLSLLPLLVVYLMARRFLLAGLTAGAGR
ncbi:carbohydrate ABC transporter permease [Pseudonocardia nematodicida]|uniref:carbohydrate ABC transporter permease n=1 Tax=Pseudonocardia nematodicida TaxID=1206997 RepID=UPI00361E0C06